MKLMLCRACGDVVKLHLAPRSCLCGAATGRYLDDQATVEQSEGTLSIALHNHDLRDAVAAYDEHADAWHPLMVFRAYLNPRSEPDVRFVPAAPPPTP